jgi:hypothetical protein
MNWKELRPVLRQKFGSDFTFYNDVYRNGTRRIKICTLKASDMCSFIKTLSPELDVKLYQSEDCKKWLGTDFGTDVTIHYK